MIASIAIGFVSVGAATVVAPAAGAATDDGRECLINAVISQDITRSFSDANLEDTKGQIEDAMESFVGSPFPVTLGITTFGQDAPLSSGPALLGVNVSEQSGADQFAGHVAAYEFDQVKSGYTNWQAGLRDAFEKAKAQGADTVIFITDGVPNAYVNEAGEEVGVDGWGTFDPAAAAAAAVVADEIRAAGMHLETVFIRTDRPGFHGLDDPELPTPDLQVVEAMQQLAPGWTIDQVITIAQLAEELSERTAAACTPALSLTKSHGAVEDVNRNGLVDVGDRVVFVFAGRNDGDLPLTGVRIADPLLTDRGVALDNGGLVGDVAIGQSYELKSAPYALTNQDMIDCGFRNVASVTGESLKGTLNSQAEDIVPVDTRPGISIQTTVGTITDVSNDGLKGNAGDTVEWNVVVTNTGNVPWGQAAVSLELVQHAALTMTPERAWDGSLAPGGMITFTSAPYTITAADEAAGKLRATATVTAPDVCATPLTGDAAAEFTPVVPQTPTPTPPAHAPRAFTGNAFNEAGGDWGWMLALGAGGIAAATSILIARRRHRHGSDNGN